MPFQYCINEEEVYGRFITPEDHEGFEVIGFRLPTIGELFISKMDGAPGEIERLRSCEIIETPRLILRKKEPKYRYVTDGVERLPKKFEYFKEPGGGWHQAVVDFSVGNAVPRLCFTREEVKE